MAMAVCAAMGGSLLLGAADDGPMAGVARVDVTPREAIWLAGYAMRDHESKGAHNGIQVTGL